MQTTLLKAKMHRVCVTHSELNYEGSCAIDSKVLDFSGIREYEQIHIYNINNGERFTTYAISAQEGSGIFSVNGAAAHLVNCGDLIIICAYVVLDKHELAKFKPKMVYFNKNNEIIRSSNSIPAQVA